MIRLTNQEIKQRLEQLCGLQKSLRPKPSALLGAFDSQNP